MKRPKHIQKMVDEEPLVFPTPKLDPMYERWRDMVMKDHPEFKPAPKERTDAVNKWMLTRAPIKRVKKR